MTSPLLTPLTLRPGITAKNRIWLAPLTNTASNPDGTLSDDELRFLERRAEGGFGLIETCAVNVTQDGKAWPGELGVHDDAMIPGLTRLAQHVHAKGSIISAQLFHGGRRADQEVSGLPTVSASAVEEKGSVTPHAATEEDIARIIEGFGLAAKRVQDAGFDAIELHGAHGYVLSQFLSTVYNQRTDSWGGSLENRARLIREVTRSVKKHAPKVVIGIRISPEDFGQARGLDLDESIQVAKWLVEDDMEILHLSLWMVSRNSTKRPEEHAVPMFRAAVGPDVRIVVAGKVWTKEDGEGQLALGADAVALGRAAILNPDWPTRAFEDPGSIKQPPISIEDLKARGLGDAFANYLRAWPKFVI